MYLRQARPAKDGHDSGKDPAYVPDHRSRWIVRQIDPRLGREQYGPVQDLRVMTILVKSALVSGHCLSRPEHAWLVVQYRPESCHEAVGEVWRFRPRTHD